MWFYVDRFIKKLRRHYDIRQRRNTYVIVEIVTRIIDDTKLSFFLYVLEDFIESVDFTLHLYRQLKKTTVSGSMTMMMTPKNGH